MATIRLATPDDAETIAAIYAPNVTDAAISFELEAPDAAEIRRRIEKTLAVLPWLVWDEGGVARGYAYASPHRERAAYQWSADVSAYIDPAWKRRGIGKALYERLLRVLRLQGYQNAYAGITLPNPASVGLHESVGFRPVGVYHQVGFKRGQWHDVGWWHLSLGEPISNPQPPRPWPELADTADVSSILPLGREK